MFLVEKIAELEQLGMNLHRAIKCVNEINEKLDSITSIPYITQNFKSEIGKN